MSEKRVHQRSFLVSYLNASDTETNKDIGYVVDISKGGMMVISKKPITMDMNMSLAINVPEEITETKTFNVTAKSIRSIKDGDMDYYSTGFIFDELRSDDLQVLDNIIAAFEL
jgi:c-di-GMP-binding flagellar brake protein YcgR